MPELSSCWRNHSTSLHCLPLYYHLLERNILHRPYSLELSEFHREFLTLWKKNYPWQHKKNNIVKRVWNTLPYSLLWNIWLARNHRVFKDKETIIRKLCNKARSLTLETISAKNQRNIDITSLCVEEWNFIGYLWDKKNSNQNRNITNNLPNNSSHNWKIRLKEEEFLTWLKNCNIYYLFFDGASKSSPGIARVGGVIFNANGERIATYEWGLAPISNNRVEALALYQGLI